MVYGSETIKKKNQTQCEVCDSVLTNGDLVRGRDWQYSVCQSIDCKRIMDKKSSMTPLFFESFLEFNKKLIRNRRFKDAQEKKRIKALNEQEVSEEHALYLSTLDKHPELTKDNTHLLVIASGKMKSELVSKQRVNKYIEHLNNIVAEAFNSSSSTEIIPDEHLGTYERRVVSEQRLDENPMLRTISDKLCTLCKGGCCVSGNEHAYLSVATIHGLMDDVPDLSEQEILDLYLSRINTTSIKESCINNTEEGCSLPRHLRSNICNGFYCEPLRSYQTKMAGKQARVSVIAIQRSSNYWGRQESGINNEIVQVALVDDTDEVVKWL